MNAATALLYARTLPNLRPVQIANRVWRQVHRARPSLEPAPARRTQHAPWRGGANRAPSLIGPRRFSFLNEERELPEVGGWQDGASRLWLYNLHCFDDLGAERVGERLDWQATLLERWIRENPVAEGVGWEAWPLSRRIVNVCTWLLAGGPVWTELVHSLALWARHLRHNLEFHLLANHLWTNAKALVFAGAFFEGPEAELWLERGCELLEAELDEQVLPDGGHFERSPMYHAAVLEDVFDLLQLAVVVPSAFQGREDLLRRLRERSHDMRRFLALLSHPDGRFALFNDAAFGVAPDPSVLESYARRLGLPGLGVDTRGLTLLEDSGYARLETSSAVCLADVGELGPVYQPGHAHADTLGFELSLYSERLFVDSGTSQYGTGEERMRQRSTAAHNTVEVDGADSSEVWAGFRVARRAHPGPVEARVDGDTLVLASSHDGYRRLPGKVVHHREWRLREGIFRVHDRLEGRFERATSRYLFHPSPSTWITSRGPLGGGELSGGRPFQWCVDGARSGLASATYHPEFGRSLPSVRLELEHEGPEALFELRW